MHPLFHSFKRAYWASMRYSRPMALEYEITPARLDMLVAIGSDPSGMAQSRLRRVLDVTASVVSVMLRSLEKLGYLFRVVHPLDRRTRLIRLTEFGRGLLDIAQAELFDDGLTELAVRVVVAPDAKTPRAYDRAFARTHRMLNGFRSRLTDISTLRYPTYLPSGERSPEQPPRILVVGQQMLRAVAAHARKTRRAAGAEGGIDGESERTADVERAACAIKCPSGSPPTEGAPAT